MKTKQEKGKAGFSGGEQDKANTLKQVLKPVSIPIIPMHLIANSGGNKLGLWFKSTPVSILDQIGVAIFFFKS